MNKSLYFSYKFLLVVDLLTARTINLISKLFKKKKGTSYILVYAPYKKEPWILNKIISDIKENSIKPNNYKIYNSLIKISIFKLINGGNIFSMHQSNIRYLDLAGFDLNNVSSYYTHTRINQSGIKKINKLKTIFCQNSYENSLLQSLGIEAKKIINFPVGVHNNFINKENKFKSIKDKKYDVLFCLRYVHKDSHYSVRKRYSFIIDLANILSSLNLKVAILGEGWDTVRDLLNYNIELLDIEFKNYNSIYQNSKIYCNPSLVEGGPISLIEAFSSGCIILTTPVGLSFNLFKDNDQMFLMMPFESDLTYWKNKIVYILNKDFSHRDYLEIIDERSLKIQESTFPNLASKLEQYIN